MMRIVGKFEVELAVEVFPHEIAMEMALGELGYAGHCPIVDVRLKPLDPWSRSGSQAWRLCFRAVTDSKTEKGLLPPEPSPGGHDILDLARAVERGLCCERELSQRIMMLEEENGRLRERLRNHEPEAVAGPSPLAAVRRHVDTIEVMEAAWRRSFRLGARPFEGWDADPPADTPTVVDPTKDPAP
jgi:hypothetical protein